MALRKDIWRPAIVMATVEQIVARGTIEGFARVWLPPMGSFRFLADPFGLWRDGRLYVFVETYDYRVRIGAIEVLVYDAAFTLVDRRPVLNEPWHLSYPLVFEAEGETWMLPESHRSKRLTLYRAVDFPDRWEAAHVIELDHVAVDATPVFQDGVWWLFYTSADREADKMSALHVAFAERLAGPWTPHPANPVRVDVASARPGGRAVTIDGRIVLPVQDCSRTYGGAIRALTITTLTRDRFVAEIGDAIVAPPSAQPFVEGLHTLSAAGPVTLVDMKRTELSPHGLSIEAVRELRKLGRRIRSRASARG
ncbi:formyl transferase [Sphingomonas ginsenosidivorax]|uniref:Formyl transferase n=1 Tax=Sphingomonas ginsenosidivorax TaxID=862135 RepID=A0A5C6UGU9_9SPHN|nr:formyl transferase [Sphingomonas ginsenosidivorax]TXC71929.1 formyl transferase [Sphingomonas ginsenosidivorax]